MTAILEMRGITKEFPGVKALSDVNLTVERGEVHAICGENGAGKSTLMKVLSGVYPHGTYDGEIVYEAEPVQFRSITDSEHKGIVIIHQELALSPHLSLAENMEGVLVPVEESSAKATDGKVSVSVRQNSPLKATLRTTRKRGRDMIYAA